MLKHGFFGIFLVAGLFWQGGDSVSAQGVQVIPDIVPVIGLSRVTGQWGDDTGSSLCIHEGEEFDTSNPARSICGRNEANDSGDPVDTVSTKINGYLVQLDACEQGESRDTCFRSIWRNYGYNAEVFVPSVTTTETVENLSWRLLYATYGLRDDSLIEHQFIWSEIGNGMDNFRWKDENLNIDPPDTDKILNDAFRVFLRFINDDTCLEENIHLESTSSGGGIYGLISCADYEESEVVTITPATTRIVYRGLRNTNPVPELCRWIVEDDGTTYSKCLLRNGDSVFETCRKFSLESNFTIGVGIVVPCRS